jgi:hypothetical protein
LSGVPLRRVCISAISPSSLFSLSSFFLPLQYLLQCSKSIYKIFCQLDSRLQQLLLEPSTLTPSEPQSILSQVSRTGTILFMTRIQSVIARKEKSNAPQRSLFGKEK